VKCIDYRGAPKEEARMRVRRGEIEGKEREREKGGEKERRTERERNGEGERGWAWEGGEREGEGDTGFYNGVGSYIGKRVNALTCFELRKASEKGKKERNRGDCMTTRECMNDRKRREDWKRG